MHSDLQPGPIEHEHLGSLWCYGWIHRLDGRTVAEAKKLAAVWQKMLEQHGRTLIGEPTYIDRGSYVLVDLKWEPYNTGKPVQVRGTRGGEQAAERRASWMTRLTGSMSSLTPTPQPA